MNRYPQNTIQRIAVHSWPSRKMNYFAFLLLLDNISESYSCKSQELKLLFNVMENFYHSYKHAPLCWWPRCWERTSCRVWQPTNQWMTPRGTHASRMQTLCLVGDNGSSAASFSLWNAARLTMLRHSQFCIPNTARGNRVVINPCQNVWNSLWGCVSTNRSGNSVYLFPIELRAFEKLGTCSVHVTHASSNTWILPHKQQFFFLSDI